MPELPEVETTIRGLQSIIRSTIVNIKIHTPKMRFFIPKNISDTAIIAYGCFCSPECGLAYLLNEHIDESVKVERTYLLNSIYCPICSYTENIKPAISPFYTLTKYFGNLSIEEFRKMTNTKTYSRYTLVDKPITLSNPEFCEDHL